MNFDKQDLENLLYTVPANLGLMERLAPQEVVRLGEVVYNALLLIEEQGYDLSRNFETWAEAAKAKITSELNSSAEYFGDTKIASELDITALLKGFFHFESGEFLNSQNTAGQ